MELHRLNPSHNIINFSPKRHVIIPAKPPLLGASYTVMGKLRRKSFRNNFKAENFWRAAHFTRE